MAHQLKNNIEKILKKNFKVAYLKIVDQTHLHIKHDEAKKIGGGHFSILIVSSDFLGKTLMERHRLIYSALQTLLKSKVHALAIKPLTPQEYFIPRFKSSAISDSIPRFKKSSTFVSSTS